MDTENRRSFVKKSLATSMTFTFSGLIRAHGEEGGETTTSNPEETTILETTFGTTWNPEETTEVTTVPPTVPITYRLESHPTGTQKPDLSWDSYTEQWAPGNLDSPTGEKYGVKAKMWVNPANGKSKSVLTIEYCAELFPNGVAAAYATPTQTTDKLTFEGNLPDPSVPAMTASLAPASKIAGVPMKTATEPIPFTGSLSTPFSSTPKPAQLSAAAFSDVTSKAPSGATTYNVGGGFTLEMTSAPDFSTLPSKATVQFTLTATSYYAIEWFDNSGTSLGKQELTKLQDRSLPVDLEIRVAPDI